MLLGAALLEAHELATGPVVLEGLFNARPIRAALICFEVLLACWILAGRYRQITRWVVIAVFGSFAVVTLGRALHGAPSCGCFGAVRVNPWVTFAFDFAAAVGVLLFPVLPSRSITITRLPCRSTATAVGIVAVFWCALAAAIALDGPRTLREGGLASGQGSAVLLRPKTWVGGKFPLLPHLEEIVPSADLTVARWLVVLYHRDCSRCQELVPKIWSRAISEQGAVRVAFLELPPFPPEAKPLIGDPARGRGRVAIGRLSGVHEWFVQTPSLIELEDGVVRRIPDLMEAAVFGDPN